MNKVYSILRMSPLLVAFVILIVSCERPVSVSPPDEPPPDGVLVISSTPAGSEIYVNNKERRRITPDSIRWLATGEYQVTLKKDYLRDTTVMVSVVEGEHTYVSIDYYSNPSMFGSISCSSNPTGAEIFIDGENTQITTPNQINNIFPGSHTLTFRKQNHRDAETTVIVKSSQITFTTAALVDTTVWKEYNTSNSDIPDNHLSAVFSDSQGILWVGFYDRGLAKFENGVWTSYRESNSDLPNDMVHCITEDTFGHIWVGCYEGVLQIEYPTQAFEQWNYRNSQLVNMNINDIEVRRNKIWFATAGGITSVMQASDGYYWGDILTPLDSDLPGENVTEIEVNDLQKWAGTEKNGVVQFNNTQHLTLYSTNNGLYRNTVSALEIDRVGTVWVGHKSQIHATGGLSRFNGISWENMSHLVNGEDVSIIYADSKNRKWVGTNKALYVISNSNVIQKFIYQSTGLNFENIPDVYEDANEIMWIATDGDGLLKFDPSKL